ncbi:ATP-dependent Clp protease adapter protein CLPS1, chloroplastic [Vitis vinifera]|uniref:ATP-dependent Clp protease adapter protein CLPS1, chloroplastic n=1 Tax=Vitis vinifera TaxID=29760 RepID=A0A438FYT6_VITVI|nr:ATP-dependent Clp protease adapter protein CLPS1, chloroplastic [Vitis vinifera]
MVIAGVPVAVYGHLFLSSATSAHFRIFSGHSTTNPFDLGDKHSLLKGPCTNRSFLMAISASGPGKGGLLERPVIEKVTPGRESEFDLR